MTDDKIALQDLLEKSSDASLLREMIGFAAQRLMALESGVKARDSELGRMARQLDKSRSTEAEVAAKNSQVGVGREDAIQSIYR